MNTFTLFTIIVILHLPIKIFSQQNDKSKLSPDKILQERIAHHPIPDKQDWNTLEAEIFKDKESRTIVNKTILQNGFLLMEHTIQNWNGSNWVNAWRYTYTYNGNNNMFEELLQEWDGSYWVNDSKYTFTFDVNNNMTEQLQQEWFGSNWINNWIYTYTYDNNNNKIGEVSQDWDGSNWVNDWRYTYTYIGNNMIEELRQNWFNSNWVNHWRETYTYDGSNNMIEDLYQEWRDSNHWRDVHKYTFAYDVNNNLLEELHEYWDGANWIICNRSIYSYIPTGVEQLTDGIRVYSLSNNYPNPFNPATTIKYQIPELSFVTLKVYNVLGNEIAILINEEKSVGSYEVEFDATGIVSGIYFYRIQAVPTGNQAGSFEETKKMVLLR